MDINAEVSVSRVGKYIQQRRKDMGLGVNQLAEYAAISPGYLSDVESGKRNPSAKILAKLAKKLKVPVSYMFGLAGLGDEISGPPPPFQSPIEELEQARKVIDIALRQLKKQASLGARFITPNEITTIPLLGHVPAGLPDVFQRDHEPVLEVILDEEQRTWLNRHVRRPQAVIAVGDSMVPHINNNDRVVFDPDRRAHDGDIVVALVGGEPTVKFFIRLADGSALRSTDPVTYPDLIIRDHQFGEIQGVVVMAIPPPMPRILLKGRLND